MSQNCLAQLDAILGQLERSPRYPDNFLLASLSATIDSLTTECTSPEEQRALADVRKRFTFLRAKH